MKNSTSVSTRTLERHLASISSRLEEKINELSLVRRISEELIRSTNTEIACRRLLEIIFLEINCDNCSIMMLEEDRLTLKAARGRRDEILGTRQKARKFKIGEGIAGRVAEQQQVLHIPDTAADEQFVALGGTPQQIGSLLCLPLINHGQSIGVLNLSNRAKHAFTPDHTRILTIIANEASILLAHLQMQEAYKRLNIALHRSEEKFRLLIDSTRDLICTTDEAHNVIFLNPAFERILGASSSEYFQQPITTFIAPKSLKSFEQIRQALEQNQDLTAMNLHFIRKDGTVIELEGRFSRYRLSDGHLSYVHIYRDLTERKKVVAQMIRAQRMEAVGNLAASIHHDLNHLMNLIVPSAQLLQQTTDAEKTRKYATHIENAAQRAAHLLDEVFNIAHPTDSHIRRIDLNGIVQDTFNLLGESFHQNIDVDLQLAHEPLLIEADSIKTGQVLMNLLLNARDAIPEDHQGIIRVATGRFLVTEKEEARTQLKPGPYARLQVEDNGIGIAEEHQLVIFDPFFSTKETGKGTGLGLAVAYANVSELGGMIAVRSEVGVGTEFTIYLPLSGNQEPVDPPAVRTVLMTLLSQVKGTDA